jgi:transposase
MAKSRFLTQESRVRVVVLNEEGYNSVQIAKKVGCSQSAVVKIFKKYQQTGSTEDKKRSGRPRKSSVRKDRVLRRTSLA